MLFIEAIANGLVPYAHENPGLYFEKAGDFQRQANEAILSMKSTRTQEQMKSANKNILLFPGKFLGGFFKLFFAFRNIARYNNLFWTKTVACKNWFRTVRPIDRKCRTSCFGGFLN